MAADFSSILSSVNAASAVSAVVAAGALIALVYFAQWASKKTATFFDGDDTGVDDDAGVVDVCDTCGDVCAYDDGTIVDNVFYCEYCFAEEGEEEESRSNGAT